MADHIPTKPEMLARCADPLVVAAQYINKGPTMDRVIWTVVYATSACAWIAVTFFDWTPDPRFVAQAAFLGVQFAAGARLFGVVS